MEWNTDLVFILPAFFEKTLQILSLKSSAQNLNFLFH